MRDFTNDTTNQIFRVIASAAGGCVLIGLLYIGFASLDTLFGR